MSSAWPPKYTLRYSKKAKRVSLKIHHYVGLEVVMPEKKRNFDILGLLNEKRTWIEKYLPSIYLNQQISKQNTNLLPKYIFIIASKRLWQINYHPGNNSLKLIINKFKYSLDFIGNINHQIINKKILNWLKLQGYYLFNLKLEELSKKTELPFNKLSIRQQTTLWGSCNNKKNISLNLKLLFLPSALVNYVLLHELCHTRYLNHSEKFWNLVNKFCPNYKILEKFLRIGDQYLPAWLIQALK